MNINLITPRSTTLAILFLSFFPTIFEFLKPFITLFCILVLGIPHGALDHILYYKLASGAIPDSNGSQDSEAFHHFGKDGENPSTELPITKSEQSKIITFYGNYLAIMGLWAGCWAMFPDLAFWGFLTLSCYHFGEVSRY